MLSTNVIGRFWKIKKKNNQNNDKISTTSNDKSLIFPIHSHILLQGSITQRYLFIF